MATETVSYDNFNLLQDASGNLDPRAYRVTLRYRAQGDTAYSTYWVGFINPVDYEENYTTTPYHLSLTASDGLVLVSDQQTVPFGDTDPENSGRVGEYLFELAYQTGTNLPVRVYHDIRRWDVYSIVESTVSDYVFHDENYTNPKSKVEAAKSILTAFNAKFFQSKGVWCVASNSNHLSGIINNTESISYKEYTYDSSTSSWGEGTSGSENNLFRFPQDIAPIDDSLVVMNRRPYFSIENKVSKQFGIPRNENGFFSSELSSVDDTLGPVWRNIGLGRKVSGDTKDYGTNRVAHTSGGLGSHFIRTNRTNTESSSNYRDVWFEVNIPYGEVNQYGANLTLISRQDWAATNVASATIGVSFAIEYRSSDFFVYNFESGVWDQRRANRRTAWNRYWSHFNTETTTKGLWNTFNISTENPEYSVRSNLEDFATSYLINLTDNFKIRIGDIKFYDEFGNHVTPNGTVTTDIDAIMLSNNTDSENPVEPFFERYQDVFSETYTYETDVFSNGPAGVRGKISPSTFNRNFKIETLSLEEIVTQQKLNDYRTNLRFYQGEFINKTSRPIHYVDKLLNDHTTESDSVSCILQRFRIDPKQNTYDIQCYRTNQATDVASTFSTKDVFPAIRNYIWTESIIQYEYELDLTAVSLPPGAVSGAIIDDFISLNIPKLTDANGDTIDGKWGFTYYAEPGQEFRPQILMTAADGYEIVGSDFSVSNLSDLETAESVLFTDTGVDILFTFIGESPDYPHVEQFTFAGEVKLGIGNVVFEATVNTVGSNFTVVPELVRIQGLSGSVHKGELLVISDTDYVLAEGDISSTSDDPDFVIGADRNSGDGVAIPYTLTLPSASDTAVITVTGSPTYDPPGADPINFVMTLTTHSNSVGVAWLDTDGETITGLPGQSKTYAAKIDALTGYFLKPSDIGSSNISVSGSDSSSVTFKEIQIIDEDAIAFFEVQFPSASASATLTLNATASGDPGKLRINLDAKGLENASYSPANGFIDQTYNLGNANNSTDSISPVVFEFKSNVEDYEFDSTANLTVSLPSYSTNGSALVATKTISNNIITVTISGGYPDTVDDLLKTIVVTGAAKFSGTYGITVEKNYFKSTGTDTINSILYDTANVKVVTHPLNGKFSVSRISGVGSVTKSGNKINFEAPSTNTPVRYLVARATHTEDSSVFIDVTMKQFGLLYTEVTGSSISEIVKVTSLPSSPNANTIYLVE